jgi:hypothetical protein
MSVGNGDFSNAAQVFPLSERKIIVGNLRRGLEKNFPFSERAEEYPDARHAAIPFPGCQT